ncbi:hydrogenase nickel incorporation protein HypB [Aminiphilus sp.]|uniref:hydrogenase nickel incorporation protein HypB n=1 Tax=Aminiphilus sp. TaxID=1872488 RepID=UPI0026165DED|nr:hydrogenase nickel incorporation protein HypB [Aminiphilus sp.]
MPRLVNIRRSVFEEDRRNAAAVREELGRRGVLLVNLIGSPGAGKTTLLEATLRKNTERPEARRFRCAVIEGDVATSRDAERIAALGVPSVQINTEGGCHLEAHLVRKALGALPLDEVDLLFVENVGNLVCPAEFDLGEDFKVAVSSVPEGDDKPLKYPHLFHLVRAVILTKMDLAPYVRFSPERFWGDVEKLNPSARRFLVDSIQGDGLEEWLSGLDEWLEEKRRR